MRLLGSLAGEPHTQCRKMRYCKVGSRLRPLNPESLCGFIAVRCAADEMEILNLAVLPESRRQGIARTLLDAAVANAGDRDVQRIYLEVRESNAVAIAFYRAMGFDQTGRRSKYYSSPVDDALVFLRVVSDPYGSSRR